MKGFPASIILLTVWSIAARAVYPDTSENDKETEAQASFSKTPCHGNSPPTATSCPAL
ncbi:hypothetical protein QET93_012450 [Akkermansia sp. N21116]|uniref:hypothetical protein n=1 Tax=Akkermansia sp. N21116 TaxID=3040764 RepID=UPI00244E5DF5|nr:hypothetical protein [Akkermansia sp. N21116]WPX40337.1 hypothetical protein QET93_012450 [Akkermansia sp. N21116]